MTQKVLILGGRGRIGSHVAQDLATYTEADIIVTGRSGDSDRAKEQPSSFEFDFLALDVTNTEKLNEAVANVDLVIHCAGPFHYRDATVLRTCIQHKVNYIDISDHRSFYHQAIEYHEDAKEAGITAVLNTGIFPGISNSMVKQGVEQFDDPETIHLSYIVAGSGGAGVTVMRTTFLGLRKPFEAWIDGEWQTVKPYSERETIEFPKPFGKTGVYWYDMPETYTFPESFPVKTAITKFGSVPDFYNYMTWIVAHVFPPAWIANSAGIEFLSHVSHKMTQFTDLFSGIGVAMRSEIRGEKDGESKALVSTLTHENTAISAGAGTGSVAQLMLLGKLDKPGVYPVEQALTTPLFQETMKERDIEVEEEWLTMNNE